MMAFLQQVFTLLTTNPGSLAYHLVLAFSLVAALLAAGYAWNTAPTSAMKSVGARMLLGLGFLLALRSLLFGVAALAWQQAIEVAALLPALERGVDLLSLVVIIWLWAFPFPSLAGDGFTACCGLLLTALILLGLGFSVEQGLITSINGSLIDGLAQLLSLGVCLAGSLLLLILRPPGWLLGQIMVFILGLGHLWQLYYPLLGNFPGSVRLAQMAAFPILIALPYRFSSQSVDQVLPAGNQQPAQNLEQTYPAGSSMISSNPQVGQGSHSDLANVDAKQNLSLNEQIAELQNTLKMTQQELQLAQERARKAEQDRANLIELVAILQHPGTGENHDEESPSMSRQAKVQLQEHNE